VIISSRLRFDDLVHFNELGFFYVSGTEIYIFNDISSYEPSPTKITRKSNTRDEALA